MSPNKIDKFYEERKVSPKEEDLQPNEFIVLKGGRQSALAKFSGGEIKPLVHAVSTDKFSVQGVSPRNKEQVFAMDMLLDPSIHMATITGRAGSGKTLLSIATAIHQLNAGIYDKIIISRPVQSTSNDIGFLPGDLREKMEPWLQPIFDNLKVVMGNGDSYIELMMDKGVIEVQALAHIRGRSLPRAIFILDESQNITLHEAKAVITRMGEGSKLIMLGDLEQIDAPHLDSSTCGLGVIVEKFKDFELAGHITLLKGERSPLATHAAKIL
jgi:PhoH-like ATPase